MSCLRDWWDDRVVESSDKYGWYEAELYNSMG